MFKKTLGLSINDALEAEKKTLGFKKAEDIYFKININYSLDYKKVYENKIGRFQFPGIFIYVESLTSHNIR